MLRLRRPVPASAGLASASAWPWSLTADVLFLVGADPGGPGQAQDDPVNGANWDASRVVRAEFLARLLTGEMLPKSGRVRAVKLARARISGKLDLEACTLVCTVLLRDCSFTESVILTEAEAVSI